MTANESTDEARKAAIEDATTDKLEVSLGQPWLEYAATDEDKDVSPPMSPDLETDNIEYRADVGQGGWMVVCPLMFSVAHHSADFFNISLRLAGNSATMSI